MSPVPRPIRISASRSKEVVTIEWEDGLHCEYPFAGLRAACPCAECRGGHENMGGEGNPDMLLIPLTPRQSDQLEAIEQVGNYAVKLVWGDGHAFGIYTWDYLRQLCPENS